MTAKEKYEALEAKRDKLTTEYQNLYARIDAIRVKLNAIDQEAREAYRRYLSEIRTKK